MRQQLPYLGFQAIDAVPKQHPDKHVLRVLHTVTVKLALSKRCAVTDQLRPDLKNQLTPARGLQL
jgi:hypothetical protein